MVTPSPLVASTSSNRSRPASGSSHLSSLIKSALGVSVALGALSAGNAQALVVNVGGQDYNVTTFTGTYDDNVSKFATANNGGKMPWWGQLALANQFANAVGSSLIVSDTSIPTGWGPYFGYDKTVYNPYFAEISYTQFTNPGTLTGVFATFEPREGAQATLVPTPVPVPLSALGAATAFGFSRKLRKRINSSKGDSSRAATL